MITIQDAVQYVNGVACTTQKVWCKSTDVKPTEGIGNGSQLREMDTGKKYLFDAENGEWLEQPEEGGGGGGGGGGSGYGVLIYHLQGFYEETETFQGFLGEIAYCKEINGTMTVLEPLHSYNSMPSETGEDFMLDNDNPGWPLYPAETGIKLFWVLYQPQSAMLSITPSGAMSTTPITVDYEGNQWEGYELTGVGYAEIVVNDEPEDPELD